MTDNRLDITQTDGRWRWSLTAPNGERFAASEQTFSTRFGALRNLALVRDALAPEASGARALAALVVELAQEREDGFGTPSGPLNRALALARSILASGDSTAPEAHPSDD